MLPTRWSRQTELQYGNPAQLRADFERIVANCNYFNEPGRSPYNYPAVRPTDVAFCSSHMTRVQLSCRSCAVAARAESAALHSSSPSLDEAALGASTLSPSGPRHGRRDDGSCGSRTRKAGGHRGLTRALCVGGTKVKSQSQLVVVSRDARVRWQPARYVCNGPRVECVLEEAEAFARPRCGPLRRASPAGPRFASRRAGLRRCEQCSSAAACATCCSRACLCASLLLSACQIVGPRAGSLRLLRAYTHAPGPGLVRPPAPAAHGSAAVPCARNRTQAQEHWLCCTRCQKWRKAQSYASFAPLRALPNLLCGMMAGKDCSAPCEGCGEPIKCTCVA